MRTTNRLLVLIDKARSRFQKRPRSALAETHIHLAEEFKHRISTLEVDTDPNMPPAQLYWNQNMLRLKKLVATDDINNFLSWDVISGTMFVKYAKYSRTEYRYLKHLPNWPRWKEALKEDDVGNPPPCPFDTNTSCNLLHHAYHIAQFEEATNLPIEGFNFVLEFGGGYGSMCRLVHRLGFTGRYLIIDLPAFTALQEYFLKAVGIKVLSQEEFLRGENGVLCTSDIDAVKKLTAGQKNGLLLATWSLSESPISVRAKVLEASDSLSAYLFAFQPAFEDINNVSYFNNWKSGKSNYNWHMQFMKHIPNQRYLFGNVKVNFSVTPTA